MAEFDFLKPDYPELLLPKTWDKKKSILSAKVSTGMGEVLKAAKAAYDKVKFEKFGFGFKMTGNNYNAAKWQELYEAAIEEAHGPLMEVARKLDEVKSTADDAKKKFTASKISPKSDVKLAEDVGAAAWAMAGAINFNRIKPAILADYELRKGQVAKSVEILQKGGKPTLALFIQAIKRIQLDGSPEVFKSQQQEARKLTQMVGNMVRYSKQGYEFGVDAKACQSLFDTLEIWANGKVTWTSDTTEGEKKLELGKMIAAAKTAGQLFP